MGYGEGGGRGGGNEVCVGGVEDGGEGVGECYGVVGRVWGVSWGVVDHGGRCKCEDAGEEVTRDSRK